MKILCARTFATMLLAIIAGSTASAQDPNAAFVSLAEAYAARDGAGAAAPYTDDAIVIYAYDGAPEERYAGRVAITQSFEALFNRVDQGLPLDLNFRISTRDGNAASGFYRLRYGPTQTSYGRFEITQGPDGRFAYDRSSDAARSDFEGSAGPLLVRPDQNDLDRGYYGLLAGRYRLPDGCDLVVTRSVVRMFVRNACDQSWRGLERVSGLAWTAGDRVLPTSSAATYGFGIVDPFQSANLTIKTGETSVTAERLDAYQTEDVDFISADGTSLAGTIYWPDRAPAPLPAVVLVHGSGPQDRDGYASIIAVLADALAAEGRVVLTYDKRGSGSSGGNGDGASFDALADDAAAALAYLRGRKGVDADTVGLAGSSQAGWVIAKAIARGAAPSDVFLLGAAGTAFTVREQNIYNTEVRMACAGLGPRQRRLAIAQQSAFFDALADRSKAERLDMITREATRDEALRDWLFPGSEGLSTPDAWFTVLDPSFDPLPIWQGYHGRMHFVFSEFDDSTDTAGAIRRLKGLGAVVDILPEAQHLGLEAPSLCDAGVAERNSFSDELFLAIARFAVPHNP
jgi:ketosteroid isomerase-like protein